MGVIYLTEIDKHDKSGFCFWVGQRVHRHAPGLGIPLMWHTWRRSRHRGPQKTEQREVCCVAVSHHPDREGRVAGSWSAAENPARTFPVAGGTAVEWHRGGEECHACERPEQRATLSTSCSIMRGWHRAVSWQQRVLRMGGVWTEPSNLPDGVGGGAPAAVHQAWPRSPGHGILEWEGGNRGPIRKRSANMNPAGNKAEISWHWTACSCLM